MMKVGTDNVGRILSDSLELEGGEGREGRGRKVTLTDLADEDPEGANANFDSNLRMKAMQMPSAGRGQEDDEDDISDEELEKFLASSELEGGEEEDDIEIDLQAMLRGDSKYKGLLKGLSKKDIMEVEELFKQHSRADERETRKSDGTACQGIASEDYNYLDSNMEEDNEYNEEEAAKEMDEILRSEAGAKSRAEFEACLQENPFTVPRESIPRIPIDKQKIARDSFVNILDEDVTNEESVLPDSMNHFLESQGASFLAPKTYLPGAFTSSSSSSSSLEKESESFDNITSLEDIEKEWDKIYFGRAPKPFYKDPIEERYELNIKRAEQLFEDMSRRDVKPNVITMNSLLAVYTEAMRVCISFDRSLQHTVFTFIFLF